MNQNDNNYSVTILIGLPGSGKTTFYNQHLSQFHRIDGDVLKTSDKVCRQLKYDLAAYKNVVVDATNVTVERRHDIIQVAKIFGAKVFGVVFERNVDLSIYRSKMRQNAGGPHVPAVAIRTCNSRWNEPHESEGFAKLFLKKN